MLALNADAVWQIILHFKSLLVQIEAPHPFLIFTDLIDVQSAANHF